MIINADFAIEITPTEPLLPTTGRFEFSKVWSGGADGASKGVMVSSGNPAKGTAGYVAMEVFEGRIGSMEGSVSFQQFGTMVGGEQRLQYEVTPGSGTGDFIGVLGELHLTIDEDGRHHVRFDIA